MPKEDRPEIKELAEKLGNVGFAAGDRLRNRVSQDILEALARVAVAEFCPVPTENDREAAATIATEFLETVCVLEGDGIDSGDASCIAAAVASIRRDQNEKALRILGPYLSLRMDEARRKLSGEEATG